MTQPAYLIAFDFDGTLANTFAPSPHGVGVNEASEAAIADLFGAEGLQAYTDTAIGGLGNRAPIELIDRLLTAGNRDAMLHHARSYAKNHLGVPGTLVPPGKGVPLDSLLNDGEPTLPALTEAFVRAKLSHLIPEIGPEWPKLMPGAKEALGALRSLVGEGVALHIAVLSSGHEVFIRKCFDVWGIPQPDILVTDDDLRAVPYLSAETKVKPSVHLLARLHQAWRRKRGLAPDQFDMELERRLKRDGMFYGGDDELRDGQLAMNNDVFFGWYNPTDKPLTNGGDKLINFKDWGEFTEFLTAPGLSQRLKEGERFGQLWQQKREGQKFV